MLKATGLFGCPRQQKAGAKPETKIFKIEESYPRMEIVHVWTDFTQHTYYNTRWQKNW